MILGVIIDVGIVVNVIEIIDGLVITIVPAVELISRSHVGTRSNNSLAASRSDGTTRTRMARSLKLPTRVRLTE